VQVLKENDGDTGARQPCGTQTKVTMKTNEH